MGLAVAEGHTQLFNLKSGRAMLNMSWIETGAYERCDRVVFCYLNYTSKESVEL